MEKIKLQPLQHSELKIQADFFQSHWNMYPHERGLLFAINNNSQNAIKGTFNKAIGVVSGVADMVYLCKYGAVFLECKTPTGKQSAAQVEFQRKVEALGLVYRIFRSKEEGLAILEQERAGIF